MGFGPAVRLYNDTEKQAKRLMTKYAYINFFLNVSDLRFGTYVSTSGPIM